MISVTAAANGVCRAHRHMGMHWKAVGSGRVALENDPPQTPLVSTCHKEKPSCRRFWCTVFDDLLALVLLILKYCFPLFGRFSSQDDHLPVYEPLYILPRESPKSSSIEMLSDGILLKICEWLDTNAVVNLEHTSSKLRQFVSSYIGRLPKYRVDQVKLHFDEGELMIYPTDEKLAPSRFIMPSVQMLALKLKHFSTSSLFIRGLIPLESTPVLRRLLILNLRPAQIYFLWCDFCTESRLLLKEYISMNANSLCDIGFEECIPTSIFDDDLIEPVTTNLVALRLWNDGRAGRYEISDKTLMRIADSPSLVLETLDVASSSVTIVGIGALIERWAHQPHQDLNVVVHGCRQFNKGDLIQYCRSRGLPVTNKGLTINNFTLSIFIA
uniref:F-box domain-containing protein n=1 Tax=Parascaris univalens TaxID=6257 RepID=A0A915C6B8_PARUN